MPATVDCPPDDALRAFALGRLDAAAGVSRHVEMCPRCRAVVAAATPAGGTLPPPRTLAEPSAWAATPAHVEQTHLEAGPPPAGDAVAPELAGLTDYKVLRQLGRGGMGAVYLARNTHLEKDYVLKVVLPQFLTTPGLADRFVREIRAAVAIGHHLNIINAFPPLSCAGGLVHVMEFVDGQDLAKVVAEQGPLPILHACSYVGQAAKGLQHALDKKLIHRDIKPQNLMLTREGGKRVVKVADFGLAKQVGGPADAGLTDTGQAMGTPDYIAPEQARDASTADTRSDVYSLGCTLYYLLAGRVPFPGGNVTEKMLKQLLDIATPIRELRPDVPEELAAVLGRMMAKDPAARHQTPGEVLKALAPFTLPAKKPAAAGDGPAPPSAAAESGSLVVPELRSAGTARRRTARVVAGAVGLASLGAILAVVAASGQAVKDGPPATGAGPRAGETAAVGPVRPPDERPPTTAAVRPPAGPAKDADATLPPTTLLEPLPVPFDFPRARAELAPAPRPSSVGVPVPTATPLARTPDPPLPPAPPMDADGWKSLFNGKNLSGWKTHPTAPGNWGVGDGVLVGRGPARSHLYTEQGDYTDFHLRVETRINVGGSSGLRVRKAFAEDKLTGYEAQIDGSTKDLKTGTLFVGGNKPPVPVHEVLVPVDVWFVEEVVCLGNKVAVLVNGREVVAYTDPDNTWTRGHLALQVWQPPTVVEFRRIDVKRLAPPTPAGLTAPERRLWAHGTGDGTQVPVGLFRKTDDKTWYECVSLPKLVRICPYTLVAETPDYVELQRDAPDKATVRLYADRADVSGDGGAFAKHYDGGWKKPPAGPPSASFAVGTTSPLTIVGATRSAFAPDGITIKAAAGTNGSIATSRTDFVGCEIVAILAAAKGVDAYVVRRNDRDAAVTSRVFDDKSGVRAGHQGRKFGKDEKGFGLKTFAYGEFFAVKLWAGDDGKETSLAQVSCNGVRTSSQRVRDDSLRTGGACGIVVTAGEVTIRSLEVKKLDPSP
jgi:hypothetical protein